MQYSLEGFQYGLVELLRPVDVGYRYLKPGNYVCPLINFLQFRHDFLFCTKLMLYVETENASCYCLYKQHAGSASYAADEAVSSSVSWPAAAIALLTACFEVASGSKFRSTTLVVTSQLAEVTP